MNDELEIDPYRRVFRKKRKPRVDKIRMPKAERLTPWEMALAAQKMGLS